MAVLTPLTKEQLQSFFDEDALKVINYFIKKSVFSQPEKMKGQDNLPIQIPKEHIEQWVVQSLGVEGVGAGSKPVDVVNRDGHWAADIKMLNAKIKKNGSLSNASSGEASLGQKFEGIGANLDQLFKQKNYEKIKSEWLKVYKEKEESAVTEFSLENLYYFILLRGGDILYIVGMKIDLSKLSDVTVKKGNKTSVFLDNFIDSNLGNTKIYKSKKRLELRLRPGAWQEGDYGIMFNLSEMVDNEGVDLRDKVEAGEDLNAFGIKKAKKIFEEELNEESDEQSDKDE